ncbi:MAG: MFS transporter [Jatrophihabitans sp.]
MITEQDIPTVRREPALKAVLVAVCLSLATVVSAVTSLNVALPDLAKDTGASQTQVSWIVDAYALVFASLLLAGGAIGDRYGRRRVLLIGLLLFGSGAAGAMATSDVTALIALRGLLGVGAALVMPATLSTITITFTDRARTQAVAIWSGVAGASAVLGLVVSGSVLELWSWHAVFGLNVVLAVASLALVLRVVPESTSHEDGHLDVVGAVLFVVTLGTIIFSIIEGPTAGWVSARTVGGLVGGGVLLIVAGWWEMRVTEPLLDPRLFRHRAFAAASLSITFQFFAFFGFVFLLLQYLQIVAGLGSLPAALCVLPIAVTLMPASRAAAGLVGKIGTRATCVAGLVLVTGGLLVLRELGTELNYVVLVGGLLLLGLGMGLAMTPATAALTDALPSDKQGVASAMNDLARELGGALGIAVLGSVLTSSITDRLHGMPHGGGASAADLPRLPGPVAALVRAAFVDGLQNALSLAAVVVAATAVLVAVLARPHREAPAQP